MRRVYTCAPELAAFIGRPPAAPPAEARKVNGETHEDEEEPMPRKAKAKPTATEEEPKKRAYRKRSKAFAPSTSGRRFGVWDDGTVEVALPKCAGTIAPTDAAELVDFINRLRNPAK